MPFYEYECGSCGHRLEALQKISDEPLVFCPECNESALRKLISVAGFRLKGSGWYETDFKNSSKKEAGKDDQSSADKPSADKSSTDKAPAAGSEKSGATPAASDSASTGSGGSSASKTSPSSATA